MKGARIETTLEGFSSILFFTGITGRTSFPLDHGESDIVATSFVNEKATYYIIINRGDGEKSGHTGNSGDMETISRSNPGPTG